MIALTAVIFAVIFAVLVIVVDAARNAIVDLKIANSRGRPID